MPRHSGGTQVQLETAPRAPTEESPVSTFQIALASDMSYLRPTLVAMTSAITHAPGPVDVHVLGVGLSDRAVGILEAACRRHPGTTLICHDATGCVADFPQTAHWSAASFAPLFVPQFVDGRVLWLDSDTLAVRSLAALLTIDLGADMVAAAREHYVFFDMWKGRDWMNDRASPPYLVTSPFPPVDYFNSGVMLMDCARIRKSPEFGDGMIGHRHFGCFGEPDHDQALLNLAFRGRTTFVDPEWNCVWGRIHYMRWLQRKSLPAQALPAARSPRIIHYVGRRKPWESRASGGLPSPRDPWWLKCGLQALRYRREASRLLAGLDCA